MSITRTLALIACCAGYAGAFDLLDEDLRVGYDWTSTKESFTQGGTTTKTDWDHSNRYLLDWIANPNIPVIGVLFGAGLSYDKRTKSEPSGDVDYSALGVHVQGGVYLSLLTIVRFELLPFVGVGRAKLEEPGISSANGSVTEYGVNLNAVVHIPVLPLCAGATVGYLHSQSSHALGAPVGTVDLKANDITAGIFIGYTF
jgi:hypothetical protein